MEKPNFIIDIYQTCIVLQGAHKKISGSYTTSEINKYKVLFPRDEEEKVNVERGVYDTKNLPKMATFKYKQYGQFILVYLRSKVKNKG